MTRLVNNDNNTRCHNMSIEKVDSEAMEGSVWEATVYWNNTLSIWI